MRSQKQFFAALLIPLSLGQWTEVSIPGQKMPVATYHDEALTLETLNSAGGFAFLLPKAEQTGTLEALASWKWSVEKTPIAKYSFPLEKKQDDFALRVGFLFSAPKEKMRIPPSIEKTLKDQESHLSYVLFYNALPENAQNAQCELSPFNKSVVNCFLPAGHSSSSISVRPMKDLVATLKRLSTRSKPIEVNLLGVWIFADSDNSHTSSKGTLSDLTLEYVQVREK